MTDERPLHPALDFDIETGRASVGSVDLRGRPWLIIREPEKATPLQVKRLDAQTEYKENRIHPAPYVDRGLAARWDEANLGQFLKSPRAPSLCSAAAEIRRALDA